MKALLISIFALTLADVALTYWGYTSGHIEEANPLLRYLFHNYPELTSIFVIVLTGVLLVLLWHHRRKTNLVQYSIVFLLLCKIAVIAIHVRWIIKI